MRIGRIKRVIGNEPAPIKAMDARVAGLLGTKLLHKVGERVAVGAVKAKEKVMIYAKRIQRLEDKNNQQ